jgi:hypothetical protein
VVHRRGDAEVDAMPSWERALHLAVGPEELGVGARLP